MASRLQSLTQIYDCIRPGVQLELHETPIRAGQHTSDLHSGIQPMSAFQLCCYNFSTVNLHVDKHL